MNKRLFELGIALLFAVVGTAAFAHALPETTLLLDVHEDTVDAEVNIPLADLERATGLQLASTSNDGAQTDHAAIDAYLTDYLTSHIAAFSGDDAQWDVSVRGLAIDEALAGQTGRAQLTAHLTMTPPSGFSTSKFNLVYVAVLYEVATHKVIVSLRQDWMNGQISGQGAGEARQIGVIQVKFPEGTVSPLEVDVSGGSYWAGFFAMVQLGMTHIASGTDHLLFLITLLLPAPLLAAGGRWGKYAGGRTSAWNITKIVTAFTLGHSFALALSGLTRVTLPQQPIEVAIALTILISAIHALRPLFARREIYVAGGFGLIHGMAFSFTLAELQLTTPQLVLSLFGFNLGIELVQLAIIVVTMPSIVVLAKTSAYSGLRIGAAIIAAAAAIGWAGDRLGFANPLAVWADALSAYGPWIVGLLLLLALIAYLLQGPKPQTGS